MTGVKKFVVLHHGYESPNPHRTAAWSSWLRRRGASVADVGNRFGPGRRLTNDSTDEFTLRTNPASGLSIVIARHLDAVEQLLEGCPIVDSVTFYELLPPERRADRRPVDDRPWPTTNEHRHTKGAMP